jgi:hypothetical protein
VLISANFLPDLEENLVHANRNYGPWRLPENLWSLP